MPSVSRSQWRAIAAKAARGEISQKTAKHFRAGDYHRLPERLHKKRSNKSLRRRGRRTIRRPHR